MKIVVLVWDFFGGGAERVAVTLTNAFKAMGHDVSVVVGKETGPNRALLRPDIPVIVPAAASPRAVLGVLRRTIASTRPDVVLSHQTTRNVIAIVAHLTCSGRRFRRVVGVEHGEMTYTAAQTRGFGLKLYFQLARLLYPFASAIVAVSDNVALSVRRHVPLLPPTLKTLPNPVVFPGFSDRAAETPSHPFLAPKTGYVFVAVGRLEEQKNYSLLLRAFHLLIRAAPARLIIYGVGKLQGPLEAERAELGLQHVVDFAGYIENPFPAMRVADALVLSSTWEGLPTVAIEALACGTQVVSTDNSAGIRMILEGGKHGWIVPLDDAGALAEAMKKSLSAPKDKVALQQRAKAFESETAARAYLDFFESLNRRVVHQENGNKSHT